MIDTRSTTRRLATALTLSGALLALPAFAEDPPEARPPELTMGGLTESQYLEWVEMRRRELLEHARDRRALVVGGHHHREEVAAPIRSVALQGARYAAFIGRAAPPGAGGRGKDVVMERTGALETVRFIEVHVLGGVGVSGHGIESGAA